MEYRNISGTTARDLVNVVHQSIRDRLDHGDIEISSEATFRFLFAWELGHRLGYSASYSFDFEYKAFEGLDSDDTFLDLLVWTNSKFKVAIEFKFPKSSGKYGSNITNTRAKICRDISRLSYLVRKKANGIRRGYFICATDEASYVNEGHKTVNPQYRTYHGVRYRGDQRIPKGSEPNGVLRSLLCPHHPVHFDWEGEARRGESFAWLRPIEIRG